MTDKTALGDRMKMYEQRSKRLMLPLSPVLARIDGRAFHTYTKGLKKPFDDSLTDVMRSVTRWLVEETQAKCGYVQSDEISLLWYQDNHKEQLFFGGDLLKLTSITASLATAKFNQLSRLMFNSPHCDKLATFDSRVWEMPNEEETVNYFIWREQDAVRNSISALAQSYFSPRQLHGKNVNQMQDMLHELHEVNWNDTPDRHKRGSYVLRRIVETPFTAEEIQLLPPKHAAHTNPNLIVKRSVTGIANPSPITRWTNAADVLFRGHHVKVSETCPKEHASS